MPSYRTLNKGLLIEGRKVAMMPGTEQEQMKKIHRLEDTLVGLIERKFAVASLSLSAKELEALAISLTELNRSVSTRQNQ